MVVGMLTRDGIRAAFNKGITAEQIISFFSANAHPELKKRSPVLPETVVDQIRLWELEKNRLRINPGLVPIMLGYLYKQFVKLEDYQEVVRYAQEFGFIL